PKDAAPQQPAHDRPARDAPKAAAGKRPIPPVRRGFLQLCGASRRFALSQSVTFGRKPAILGCSGRCPLTLAAQFRLIARETISERSSMFSKTAAPNGEPGQAGSQATTPSAGANRSNATRSVL